jgi:SAM-dependent methyltransferase
MGDFNQYLWIQNNAALGEKSILEIGSKFYNKETSMNYRDLFPNAEYIGSDMEEGENVDIRMDITSDFNIIDEIVGKRRFDTIICCSVLEHIDDIFKASQNISRLMNSNGIIFLSVPFVWEQHGYPSDYWRFTPEALKFLFSDFDFNISRSTISSNVPYDMNDLKNGLNRFIKPQYSDTSYSDIVNPLVRKFKRGLKFISDPEFRRAYLQMNWDRQNKFKKACINMVGVKR